MNVTVAVPPSTSAPTGTGGVSTSATVPVASASRRVAPEAFDSVSVKVSSSSAAVSASACTVIVFSVSPAAKVSVPEADS